MKNIVKNIIPIAKEFYKQKQIDSTKSKKVAKFLSIVDYSKEANIMIEFAKLHVEAALKAAAEENYPSTKSNFELVNERFLNAYPSTNIK